MNLADITVGFEQIITIVVTVAWFIRLEAKTNNNTEDIKHVKETELVAINNSLSNRDSKNELLLQRIASLEAKIDLLLKKQ